MCSGVHSTVKKRELMTIAGKLNRHSWKSLIKQNKPNSKATVSLSVILDFNIHPSLCMCVCACVCLWRVALPSDTEKVSDGIVLTFSEPGHK